MASPGRSPSSRSSWSAVASRLSPFPDQFAQSEFDISSPRHQHPTERTEDSDRFDNRTLTINTTSAEALGSSARADGEAHDPEEEEASPIHHGGPMQDIPRQSYLELSGNNTEFSANLRGIPVDLLYSMNHFFAEESEALKIPGDSAENTESNLSAAKRYVNQMEEDEALHLIGSVHAQNSQTCDNQNLELAPASLPAASNHTEAATAELSEGEQVLR